MKLIQKSLALILSGALLAVGFSGCASSKPAEESVLDADGNRVVIESVATIEGKPVTLGEFRSILLPIMDMYSAQMGPDVWTQYPDIFNSLKDSTLDNIRWERVSEKYAGSKGLTMTDKEKALELDAYIAKLKEQMGGDVAYAGQLAQAGYTETTFRAQLELQPYTVRLENEIGKDNGVFSPTDDEVKADFQANYLRAKHILISSTDSATGEPRDDATVKALAEEALARAKAGEDFAALITEYGEDPGMTQSPEGYYFKEGDMVAEFYEGTKALADNAISGLIKSDYGYHIIQRLPLEDSYFDTVKTDMKRSMAGKTVNEEINVLIEQSPIEKTEQFDLITATNVVPEGTASSSSAEASSSTSSSAATASSEISSSASASN